MDAFSHVNNSVFFRYFETARIQYFEKAGIVTALESSIRPILASTSCKFIRPVTYPSSLEVGAQVMGISEFGLTMDYGIFLQGSELCMALGSSNIVSFNYEVGEKVSLPEQWRLGIETVEGGTKIS